MREKLIELICSAKYNVDRICVERDWCNGCPAEYGEGQCKEAYIADHLIANGVTIQRWIPASEPPEKSGMYNVTVEKLYGITYSDVAYFDHVEKRWGTNTHHYSCDKVTHWMPLPKPHKET